MAKQYYDRYEKFKVNNQIKPLPFIQIPVSPNDISAQYNVNSRLDIMSQQYYGVPYYGWLILQANPMYGSLEFNIPVGSVLRIPYPLINALQAYQQEIDKFDALYGIKS
jgi:hypothetical protein